MSSKLGLILSMMFVIMFFLFGVDLICIQYVYSDLDAKSISISSVIFSFLIKAEQLLSIQHGIVLILR